MPHLPHLIADLSLILVTAAFVTLLFRKLNQPLVLGYLIAGLLVGPHNSLFPTVTDLTSVQMWAELGIIFLLFGLGLEFSFKKMARTGKSSGIAAVFEIAVMIFLGYFVGRVLGWKTMDSIFLGGILAISSTSIILRVVDELGIKSQKYVSHVFGILIFEDLAAILLMVIMSTVAISQQFSGLPMLGVVLKLLFFLSLWFIVGMFALPTFMKKAQKIITEETVLVISIGLCLFMVVFANKVGFSSALGAFVAGSLLAETIEAERIHHLIKPVRDLFSAVFFVSVGMLIDPQILINQWHIVLLLSGVVIFGKTLSVSVGSLLAGQSFKSSIQSGLTLSQIGEFSFIIATVGLSLKVISESLYPLAVAVSVITAFTTPYAIRSSERIAETLERLLPRRLINAIEAYANSSLKLSTSREYQELLRAYLVKIVTNSVIVIGIFLFSSRGFLPWLLERQVYESSAKFIVISLTLVASAPFLWGIAFGRVPNIEFLYFVSRNGVRAPNYVFLVSRVMIAVVLLAVMIAQFLGLFWGIAITLWMFVMFGVVLSKYLEQVYMWFESRFILNIAGEPAEIQKKTQTVYNQLAPWDAHLTEFEIKAEAQVVGQALFELGIREKFGVTVALIERGHRLITAPSRYERLMAFDKIYVIGTDEQLLKFQKFIETQPDIVNPVDAESYSLEQLTLVEGSTFIGRPIRDSGVREATSGLVVGIERSGKRILNPDSSETLLLGDVLWIVGDKGKISSLYQQSVATNP